MRKLIIEIEAARVEQEIEWEEDTPLDRDSLHDFWVYPIISEPEYTWKVIDEDGNDVTSEYDYQ